MQFLAGNALLLTGICLVFGVILLVLSVVGALDLVVPLSVIIIFGSLVPASAPVAQRLHDLGRSASGPLVAFGLAVAAQGVAAAAFFDAVHGLFGGWLARSLYNLGLSQVMSWAPFACTLAAMFVAGPLRSDRFFLPCPSCNVGPSTYGFRIAVIPAKREFARPE